MLESMMQGREGVIECVLIVNSDRRCDGFWFGSYYESYCVIKDSRFVHERYSPLSA